MSPAEMDADLAEARALLSCTALTLKRCEHVSVDQTALWVFEGDKQIASISRLALASHPRRDDKWSATRMSQGQAMAHRWCATLAEACAYAIAKNAKAA